MYVQSNHFGARTCNHLLTLLHQCSTRQQHAKIQSMCHTASQLLAARLLMRMCVQENKVLIQEIGVLRESIKELKDQLATHGARRPAARKAPPASKVSLGPSRALSKSGSVMSECAVLQCAQHML